MQNYLAVLLLIMKHTAWSTYLLHFFLTALLVVGFSSCVTSRKVNYMQPADKHIPAYADTLNYSDYQLQKGDRLYIHVYAIDENTANYFNGGLSNSTQLLRYNTSNSSTDLYTYVVDNEGCITFPSIGQVPVRGLTTREVKHRLEELLSGVLIQEGTMPNMSVEVQIVQRFFSVIGAQASGRFSITKEKVTIFEALAMAKDIADFGDRSKVHIIREHEDSTIIKTFDVRSEDIINSEFYYVEPNDVIYIQQIKGKSFGINSAGAAVSVAATTLSFGVFVYTLVDRFIIQKVKKEKAK